MENTLKILLLAGDPDELGWLQELLGPVEEPVFQVRGEGSLAAGLARLEKECFDALLFHLHLPDSRGMTTFFRLRAKAPQLPLIVLVDLEDGDLGLQAVQRGAQDSLIRSQVTRRMLVQTICAGIEHLRHEDRIREMASQDPLTRLYNRQGLAIVAGHQLRLTLRTKSPMVLVFADIDRLDDINQDHGYLEGDAALRATADVMRKTFRQSDIMARLDADEFVLLALNCTRENAGKLTERWSSNLKNVGKERRTRYDLTLSMGVAAWDPEAPCSLEQLLVSGEWQMRKNKQAAARG